jgi:hypothetical protein
MTPPRRIHRNELSAYFMGVLEKHHGSDWPYEEEEFDFFDDERESELPEEEP